MAQTKGADFLGSLLFHHYHFDRSRRVLSGFVSYVSAVRLELLPFNALFRQCADVSLLRLRSFLPYRGCGILTACPSTLSRRRGVRSRLTLIRLALIRNPWSYGEGVSRSLCRYLYLHLLFLHLQQYSRITFTDGGMLPYQTCVSTSSAPDLCPIIIHAEPLD